MSEDQAALEGNAAAPNEEGSVRRPAGSEVELAGGSGADTDGTDTDGTDTDGASEQPAAADPDVLRAALEAVLLVVDEPVPAGVLARAVELPESVVTEALAALARAYDDESRGFELRAVAGGWRLYTRPHYAEYVERFVRDGQQARLTQAALETLAVVAYRQPVSRSRVSAVRGVNVDGVMRTLLTRGLVEEAGTDEDGGAHLYRTTPYFLERLGLASLDDLPDISAYLPDTATLNDLDEQPSS